MPNFEYTVVKKRGLSTSMSISVSGERGVVVRAPFWMPKNIIDGFVRTKGSWIEKHLFRQKRKQKPKLYFQGERHLYFGQEYPLSITTGSKVGRIGVDLVGEEIQVEIHREIPRETYSEKIKDALLHWYLEKGIEVVTEKVNRISQKMEVDYSRINLKKVTSIWGSCSPSGCLSFNRKLIMAPHEVVDYVVIHEVAHLRHRNHGTSFWNLVERFDPLYKSHRKWLRKNHHLLDI